MKKITALIIGKRNENTVNLYLDGEYYANIPIDFVVNYHLKKDMEISDDILRLIEYDNSREKAYNFMLESVSRRPCSAYDMRMKLINKGYPHAIADDVVERGIRYGFINDKEYALQYVEINAKKKGVLKIKLELKKHGISDTYIHEALMDTDEFDAAFKEAEKYAARLKISEIKDRNKLIRHLQYKGYSWKTVNRCLSKLNIDTD